MPEYQVKCINKPHRDSTHEHITHIGNPDVPWRITREDAINRISRRTDMFFTLDEKTGKRAEVGIVQQAGKPPYLRTFADGVWNDNLLALPECPVPKA